MDPVCIYEGTQINGFLDECNRRSVRGWVWSPNSPHKSLKVDLYLCGERLETLDANLHRPDLKLQGIGGGDYGFEFTFPADYPFRSINQIRAMVHGNGRELFNSPQIIMSERYEKAADRLNRQFLADLFIRGDGIEIGALHNANPVPAEARVQYVDRMTKEDLLRHYPELGGAHITAPDICCDGETLDAVGDGTLDFVIANHFLEHCQNPIRTIENMLRRLKNDGILFLAVPDKRYIFDVDRPVTPIEHLFQDYVNGPERSYDTHFEEWAKYAAKTPPSEMEKKVEELKKQKYSIHFHAWTQFEFMELFIVLKRCFDMPFELLILYAHKFEIIAVLRKT